MCYLFLAVTNQGECVPNSSVFAKWWNSRSLDYFILIIIREKKNKMGNNVYFTVHTISVFSNRKITKIVVYSLPVFLKYFGE